MLTLNEALKQATITVPEAGHIFFGLCRNSAYEAAKSGLIPTIKIGSRIRVPVAPLAEKVGRKAEIGRAA